MAPDIWRDVANNKVYVKNGSETIEVPHAIAEAYRQDEAKLLKELKEEHVLAETLGRCYEDSKVENKKLREELESVGTAAYLYGRSELKVENDKLRELVGKLLYGLEHDASSVDALVWSQEVNTMLRELGIEVDE